MFCGPSPSLTRRMQTIDMLADDAVLNGVIDDERSVSAVESLEILRRVEVGNMTSQDVLGMVLAHRERAEVKYYRATHASLVAALDLGLPTGACYAMSAATMTGLGLIPTVTDHIPMVLDVAMDAADRDELEATTLRTGRRLRVRWVPCHPADLPIAHVALDLLCSGNHVAEATGMAVLSRTGSVGELRSMLGG